MKVRKKNFVGQQMYGLLLGGSYYYFDGGVPPDTTDPIISNIQVINITETTATVTWDTDEPSTSVVDYGLTSSYTDQESNPTLVTSHSINLTGLTEGTTYHFAVTSVDAAANSASSADDTFDTDAAVVNSSLRSTTTSTYAHRTAAGLPSSPPYTVCFWVRREADIAGQGAFSLHNNVDPSDNGYCIFYNFNSNNTSFAWEQGGGAYPQLGEFTLPLNTWTFIAVSYTGTGASQVIAYRRIETDVALTSQTGTFPTAPTGSGITRETILTHSFDLVNTFRGRIASLKVWTRALSEVELLAESHSPTAVSSTNLFQSFPTDSTVVADNLLDESGNANNLTAVGTLLISDPPNYS